MRERTILSEKLEDSKAAAEWGIRQGELIKKRAMKLLEDCQRNTLPSFYLVMHKKRLMVTLKKRSNDP